jgi:pre-mRNA-splicing factor CDC5/CEF1
MSSGAPNGAGVTPLRTPARDDLGINAAGGGVRIVPRRGGRPSIGFESLPAPVNDFAIMVPEDEDLAANDTSAFEEDAAERDARLQRKAEERKRKELARRSQPVQRALPRPVNVDSSRLERTLGETNTGKDANANATQLIQDEMVRLLAHDSIAFPLPGTIHPGRTVSQYEMPDDDAIAVARTEIDGELATGLGYPIDAKERVLEGLMLLVEEEENGQESPFSWAKLRHTLSYDLQQRRWVETASMTDSERVIGITKLLNDARDKMRTEADKAKKLERKLAITLGGYQARAGNISKKVADGYNSLGGLEGDLAAFGNLAIIEGGAVPKRLESLREEVAVLERRERGQQDRYRDLMERKDSLLQNIAKLEDEQMAALESMDEV